MLIKYSISYDLIVNLSKNKYKLPFLRYLLPRSSIILRKIRCSFFQKSLILISLTSFTNLVALKPHKCSSLLLIVKTLSHCKQLSNQTSVDRIFSPSSKLGSPVRTLERTWLHMAGYNAAVLITHQLKFSSNFCLLLCSYSVPQSNAKYAVRLHLSQTEYNTKKMLRLFTFLTFEVINSAMS